MKTLATLPVQRSGPIIGEDVERVAKLAYAVEVDEDESFESVIRTSEARFLRSRAAGQVFSWKYPGGWGLWQLLKVSFESCNERF